MRVEDAPATRSEADYNFISNEIFVGFATVERQEPVKRFGLLPGSRDGHREGDDARTISKRRSPRVDGHRRARLRRRGMLQYLRAERIIPPYQTRGYKLVELVRIYEVGTPRRS